MTAPTTQHVPAGRPSGGGAAALFLVGALLVLTGFGPLAAGIAVAAIGSRQAADGVISTPTVRLSSADYAITAPELRVRTDVPVPDGFLTMRVEVRGQDAGDALFVGIAAQSDTEAYLDDVAHSALVDRPGGRLGRTEGMGDGMRNGFALRDTEGAREPDAPGDEDFWVVSDSGTGDLRIDVPIRNGDWAIVVMNEDASRGVEIAVRVGARSDLIVPAAVTLLPIGGALLLGGLALVIVGVSVVAGRPAGTSPPTA